MFRNFPRQGNFSGLSLTSSDLTTPLCIRTLVALIVKKTASYNPWGGINSTGVRRATERPRMFELNGCADTMRRYSICTLGIVADRLTGLFAVL